MLENKVKWALKRDEAVFGTGVTGPIDLPTLRVLAESGVQWLFTDLEHGSLDVSGLLAVTQIADMLGMLAVPRIPDLAYHWVARSLDTGAMGVMVPRIETAEQAALAVRYALYPPQGGRGMGSPSRLSYAPVGTAEGLEITNRETMIVLQIETLAGVESVEAIAAVPGVDALFIGPLDLSISIGRPGDVASDESHALMRRVCAAARANGLAVGIVCSAEQVGFYHEMGVRMFSCGGALGYMRAGVRAAVETFQRYVDDARLA